MINNDNKKNKKIGHCYLCSMCVQIYDMSLLHSPHSLLLTCHTLSYFYLKICQLFFDMLTFWIFTFLIKSNSCSKYCVLLGCLWLLVIYYKINASQPHVFSDGTCIIFNIWLIALKTTKVQVLPVMYYQEKLLRLATFQNEGIKAFEDFSPFVYSQVKTIVSQMLFICC